MKKYRFNTVTKNPSHQERLEIDLYKKIFTKEGFDKHYQVNNFITDNLMWHHFSAIRTKNTHVKGEVHGINPWAFSIICDELKISGAGGSKLIYSQKW